MLFLLLLLFLDFLFDLCLVNFHDCATPNFLNIFNLYLVFHLIYALSTSTTVLSPFLNISNISIVVVALGFFISSLPYQLSPRATPNFLNIFNFLSIYLSTHLAVFFSVNLSIDLFHSLNIYNKRLILQWNQFINWRYKQRNRFIYDQLDSTTKR